MDCAGIHAPFRMQDFRKLRVWQKADDLTFAIYAASKAFPHDERFGLTAQIRSAALSIQSNIAEGFGRGTKADTARFLQMAIGSGAEVANHLHVARRLGYLSAEQYKPLSESTEHVRRMLIRLLLRLKPQA
jgi:four helix bundle protein